MKKLLLLTGCVITVICFSSCSDDGLEAFEKNTGTDSKTNTSLFSKDEGNTTQANSSATDNGNKDKDKAQGWLF